MLDLDLTQEIAALRSTFRDIRAVVDVDALEAEIARLSEQAGAPDLWDDTEKAQKVTSALSHRQSELARVKSIDSRLDDLEVLVELAQEAGDEETAAEARAELASLQKAHRRPRGADAARRRVGRPPGGHHHPRRRRRRGCRGLRRDAHAHVPALGREARLQRHRHGHELRRGGGHQVGDLRDRRALRVRHAVASRPARTASCA